MSQRPRIVTFGEIMARLTPPGYRRLRQALPGTLDVTFGGAEANVAVSIANFGGHAMFATLLPNNDLGDACVAALRAADVDTSMVQQSDLGRMGLYFVERGAHQRPSQVLYDRENSSMSLAPPGTFSWSEKLRETDWFHITGITPALSRNAAESAIEAVREAKKKGATVCCDLNFRSKLWRWEESTPPPALAERTLGTLLESVDLLIGNAGHARSVLSIRAPGGADETGQLAMDRHPDLAREICRQFPSVSRVALTWRENVSASHNNWGVLLYDRADDCCYLAPLSNGEYRPFEVRPIVDRIGAGDAFAGGLIFSLTTPELAEPQTAISFATAASCLAHSIEGDFSYVTRREVESLLRGDDPGNVIR